MQSATPLINHQGTANHLTALLDTWHPLRDERCWVLGTVYKTHGPSYRKPGSMMLCDDLGRYYGLLSGGCLESDIQHHAQKVLSSGRSTTLCYDGSDEDDISFQLGIGCGGKVHILLQPITRQNHYLYLDTLRDSLAAQRAVLYRQKIPVDGETCTELCPIDTLESKTQSDVELKRPLLTESGGTSWLTSPIKPPPHILIAGGGVDARPMAQLFSSQGWRVSLCDPRPANARPAYFPGCRTFRCHPDALASELDLNSIDAAVAMTHNLNLDAATIRALHNRPLRYLGLLGPLSRRDRVLALSRLEHNEAVQLINGVLRAPIGLNIGGELPENIALSTCAEIQAVLNGKDGRTLSECEQPLAQARQFS